jgi:hypothetical protein
VGRRQLLRCGLSGSAIDRWLAQGRLRRIHPGVYALGHSALREEARLTAALIYAGPGAVLSHASAAWWWQLVPSAPGFVQISALGDRGSIRGVRVFHPRLVEPVGHRGMPVTAVPRTLLDLAGIVTFAELRRALSEADYRRLLDPRAVEAQLGRGRLGSGALRRGLEAHMPRLAKTLSVLEERFLALCESSGITLPEVNETICGLRVDALWREQRLIVELDGYAAHGSRAAIERDRRRELTLRSAGNVVLRYTWEQVTEQPEQVVADLRLALSATSLGVPGRAGAKGEPYAGRSSGTGL